MSDTRATGGAAGEVEFTPCGRGAESWACSGCYCGLETRQNVRLRAERHELLRRVNSAENRARLAEDRERVARDQVEKLTDIVRGFIDCADKHIWPSKLRVVDARLYLNAQEPRT